jgi:hypothetical protein
MKGNVNLQEKEMDRNDDRDGDRRRGTPVPRATKMAALERGELPDYGHLRHIMSEITKLVFFRKVRTIWRANNTTMPDQLDLVTGVTCSTCYFYFFPKILSTGNKDRVLCIYFLAIDQTVDFTMN